MEGTETIKLAEGSETKARGKKKEQPLYQPPNRRRNENVTEQKPPRKEPAERYADTPTKPPKNTADRKKAASAAAVGDSSTLPPNDKTKRKKSRGSPNRKASSELHDRGDVTKKERNATERDDDRTRTGSQSARYERSSTDVGPTLKPQRGGAAGRSQRGRRQHDERPFPATYHGNRRSYIDATSPDAVDIADDAFETQSQYGGGRYEASGGGWRTGGRGRGGRRNDGKRANDWTPGAVGGNVNRRRSSDMMSTPSSRCGSVVDVNVDGDKQTTSLQAPDGGRKPQRQQRGGGHQRGTGQRPSNVAENANRGRPKNTVKSPSDRNTGGDLSTSQPSDNRMGGVGARKSYSNNRFTKVKSTEGKTTSDLDACVSATPSAAWKGQGSGIVFNSRLHEGPVVADSITDGENDEDWRRFVGTEGTPTSEKPPRDRNTAKIDLVGAIVNDYLSKTGSSASLDWGKETEEQLDRERQSSLCVSEADVPSVSGQQQQRRLAAGGTVPRRRPVKQSDSDGGGLLNLATGRRPPHSTLRSQQQPRRAHYADNTDDHFVPPDPPQNDRSASGGGRGRGLLTSPPLSKRENTSSTGRGMLHLPPRMLRQQQLQHQEDTSYSDGASSRSYTAAPSSTTGRGLLHMRGATTDVAHQSSTMLNSSKSELMALIVREGNHICKKENELLSLIGQNPPSAAYVTDHLNDVRAVCFDIAHMYQRVMPQDLQYSYQNNLETHMWKKSFYKTIEYLRQLSMQPSAVSNAARQSLDDFLEDAIAFYKTLVEDYQEMFGFSIDERIYWSESNYFPSDDLRSGIVKTASVPAKSSGSVRLAMCCSQRFTLALGDLYRYSKRLIDQQDFQLAKKYYLMSAQMFPGNGRVFNQLALLAVQKGRTMESIYYYCRALSCKYPFATAQQSLVVMFAQIIKKVDLYESELAAQLYDGGSGDSAQSQWSRRTMDVDRSRSEIWHGGAGQPADDNNSNPQQDKQLEYYHDMPVNELFKRVEGYFLAAAGYLITKINMNQFETIGMKAMVQLRELLQRSESPLSATKLLRLASVCVFAVYTASKPNEQSRDEPGTCSVQAQHAVQLLLSVWALLLEVLDDQLPSHDDGRTSLIDASAERLLPSVWLLAQFLSTPAVYAVYSEMPMDGIETEQLKIDVWGRLVSVGNKLTQLKVAGLLVEPLRTVEDERTLPGGEVGIILPESTLVCSGFQEAFTIQRAMVIFSDKGLLALPYTIHARLHAVLDMADFVAGTGHRSFKLSSDGTEFVVEEESARSLQQSTASRPKSPMTPPLGRRRAASDDEEDTGVEQLTADIKDFNIHKRADRMKEAILSKEADSAKIVLEVYPEYLVPDTNAWIDHLTLLQNIVALGKYHVCIPVIALQELKGLSRISQNKEDKWVTVRAQRAVSYLEQETRNNNKHLSSVTSNGSRIAGTYFASEADEPGSKEENDDRILRSCAAFVDDAGKDRIEAQNLGDGVLRVNRRVVLLTEDRGLRTKAHRKNIPVRGATQFARWAGIVKPPSASNTSQPT